ncbi:MAG: hypothetical protein EBS32_12500 [Actinobacteria bacterium]|nr:hypothetical protein [Actinomycetota bacterium]
MPAPASLCTRFNAGTQQALVLLLSQQLADAQFHRADARGTERLWREVAALEIDPERVTALLYGGQDMNDREALRSQDDAWLAQQNAAPRRGWALRNLHLGRPQLPQQRFSRV